VQAVLASNDASANAIGHGDVARARFCGGGSRRGGRLRSIMAKGIGLRVTKKSRAARGDSLLYS
jgi:hypothetical protein